MPTALWLFEFPTLNGGEHSLLASLPCLRQAGWRLTAASPAGPIADALDALGVPRVELTLREGRQRVDLVECRRRLQACIESTSPDLVHANSLSMARIAGPVCYDARISSLGHIRDIVRLSRSAVTDLNQIGMLIAVSEATRRWHVRQGVQPRLLVVRFNGVDLNLFSPHRSSPLRQGLKLAASEQVVLAIGQIGMRKGLDTLLRSMLTLPPHVHLVIVGERNSEKAEAVEYERDLRALAADERIHFWGRRADVAELLPGADVVAHAARQEPLGRVLLEAAAAGRAIVATDVGGSGEIFPVDSHAALLTPPDDEWALSRALRQFLNDPDQRRCYGRRARRRMEQAFDIRLAGARLAADYAAARRLGS